MNSLEGSVMRVLFSPTMGKLRPIEIGSNIVTAKDYAALGNKFKREGKPAVKFYPNLSCSGYYEPGPNNLWFKFSSSAGDLVKESVIVHELTHALLDMKSADVMIGDAEAIAYVAQCQYFILNNKNPAMRLMDDHGEGTPKDLVFELAMSLAARLIGFENLKYDDYFELRQAVSNDPEYYRDYFTPAAYNGL